MASTYLTKVAPAAGNRTKGTISMWVKRGSLGSTEYLYTEYLNSTDHGVVYFSGANGLNIVSVNGNSAEMQLSTNRVFRDINAWYHLVFAWDTSQGTAADRVKMYVNGVQETSFSTATYPSQSSNLKFGIGSPGGNNYNIYIGRKGSASDYFTGSMSHFHRVDNQQLTPSTFGSTDSTTGEWKINTSPSITYTGSSSHNFFILKDGNSVTDQSSNTNNFTVDTGTLTKTEDNPSNVFATLNPLFGAGGAYPTMSNGNTTSYTSTLGVAGTSTLGASSGKYYAEFKHSACTSGGPNEGSIGICDTYFISRNSNLGGGSSPGYQEYSLANWGLRNSSGRFFYSSGGSKYTADNQHAGWSLGDIIMLGLDCDNNRLYFGKNGQWASSNTWSSSTPSQYITIDPTNFEGNYHFACGDSSGGNVSTWQCNFGNGYFGTTAVSSAGTNASGIGIFEYDVPTGFTALSTKGLNE